MKIAQMLDTLYWGGAQRMQLFLVETLAPLGIDITVIDLSDTEDKTIAATLTAAGARVVSYPFDLLFSPRAFYRLTSFLRAEKFDLLHTYLTYSNIIGGLAGKVTGTPVIASLRSAGYDQADYSPKRNLMETLALRHTADFVMANGEAVAQFARQRIGDDPKIKVVANAVDFAPPLSQAERQSLRASLLGGSPGPLIVSVGRLVKDKGFADLFHAFATLLSRYPSARLAIAGEGPEHEALEALIASLGLEQSIQLLGDRNDARQLMETADVYVNASLREGTPVSVLEAMAAGLPIVATQVGETPYLLAEQSGSLVPPANPQALAAAIDSLLAAPDLRQAMGQAALERVKNRYSRAPWQRNLLKLYTEVTPLARQYLSSN